MSTKVEKSILVNVPVGTVYNQWTQFEEFPQFMSGVKTVSQTDDRTMHWVAEIGGIKREWDAAVLEQVPDTKVAWAATSGATNAGAVYFEAVSTEQTSVRLELEYEPEGIVEKIGDAMNFISKQAESDLERFKAFIESEGYATGAWRGSVNEGVGVGTPGVESAAASQGDSGKSGFSAKAVLAAAAVAGVGVAAVTAAKSSSESAEEEAVTVTSDEPVVAPPIDPVIVEETLPTPVEPLTETSGARPGEVSASYGSDQSGYDSDQSLGLEGGPASTAGFAPVQGMPGLTGASGAPGFGGRSEVEDQGVTDLDEQGTSGRTAP